MLLRLNFQLTAPNAFVFLKRFAKVAGIATTPRSKTELLAHYLVELTLQEYKMLKYLPSLLCAAAIWLALKTRGEPPWSAALEQHSGYTEAELQPCVRELHALHGKAASSGLQAVHKKYAHEACRNVSAIEPLCAAQLDPVPPAKAAPPVVALRENLYSAPLAGAAAPRTTRHGPKSAARRWAGADIVVVD